MTPQDKALKPRLATSELTAIRSFWTPLRQAGAVARTLLISAATKQ